jgi:indole-3-glycerol phosphate synthase
LTGTRRFSQAISEGDGISVVAEVGDAAAARTAESQGAEGIAVRRRVEGLREATSLPILWVGRGPLSDAQAAGADACVIGPDGAGADGDELARLYEEALELGLDCVVEVRDEEELEAVLERVDPEILLLSARGDGDYDEALERALDLLPDVPAGKLAIADVPVSGRETVVALERVGVDAVIVAAEHVAELVDGPPPEV